MGITAGLTRSLTQATPLEQSASVDWTPNLQGVKFNGSDESASFSTPSEFSGKTLNTFDCTLSAWAKYDTINSYEAIIQLGTYDLQIAPTSTTEVGIWVDNAAYGGAVYAPTLGVWNHYVATKSGNTYTLYVNGVQIGQNDDADNATVGVTSFIGHNGTTSYLDGSIDEVSIFPRALLASEVSDIYNDGRPEDLTKYNPLSWWRMGDTKDGSGATVSDLGYGKNDATLVNIPLHSKDTASSYSNYSILFNGSDECVEMKLPTVFTNIGSNDCSVSVWFKHDTVSGTQRLFEGAYDTDNFVQLVGDSSDGHQLIVKDGGTFYTAGADSALSAGQWYHFVGVWDASANAAKLYLDGVLQSGAGTSGYGWGGTQNAYMACRGGNHSFLDGNIDSVAVWDSALTSAQVNDLYNGGLPSSITGAEHWWRMGEDESGTGGVVADALGVASDALYLPGVASNYASVPDAANLDGWANFTMEVKGATFADWTPSADQGLMSKYKTSTNQRAWNFYLFADGTLGLNLSYDGAAAPTYTSTAATGLAAGATADLMVKRNGSTIYFFVNGSLLGTSVAAVSTALFNSSENVIIGAKYNTTSHPMAGSMQRARIWNSAVASESNPTETPVLDADFTRATHGSTSFACTSGQTVTINSTSIDNPAMIREVSDGVLVNTPTSSRSVPAEDASYNHRSITFNGSDEYMDASLSLGTGSYTVSSWVKWDSTGDDYPYWFDNRDASNTGGIGAHLYKGGDSQLKVYVFHGGPYRIITSYDMDVDTWAHLCLVKDGTTLNMYKNGVLWETFTGLGSEASGETIRFGARYTAANFHTGGISDAAVFSYALSAATVTAIYNNGVPADLSKYSPTNWWRMGEGDDTGGTQITDIGSLQAEPTELMTNGSFAGVADATDPVTGLTGWSAYGSPTTREIRDEQLKLVTTAGNQGTYVSATTIAGLTYEFTCDYVDADGNLISAPSASVYSNQSWAGNSPLTPSGKLSVIYTAGGTTLETIFRGPGNTAGTAYYDNLSLKQVAKGNPGGLANVPTWTNDTP